MSKIRNFTWLLALVVTGAWAASFGAATSPGVHVGVEKDDGAIETPDAPPPPSPLTPTTRPLQPGDLTTLDQGMQAVKPEQVGPPILPGTSVESAAPPDEEGNLQEKIQLWRVRPIFRLVSLYDDNIFISDTNRVSDIIFAVSAGLAFEIGDYRNLEDSYLIVQYVGTGLIYLDNPQEDAYNQLAGLEGKYVWNNLAVELSSRYEYLSTPDRDVGGLVRRSVFDNSLRFVYGYSDKTSADLEFSQNAIIYVDDLDSNNYAVKLGAEYLVTEKLSLGAEGVAGVLNVQESPLQYYQQLRVRAAYDATGKLTFRLSVGVEARELDNLSQTRLDPVFSLGGDYSPFPSTTISFDAYRRVEGSASSAGQDYNATGFVIAIEQRLFEKFSAKLALGYENDAYFSTDDQSGVDRLDNFVFARPELSATFFTHYKASVFYEFRRNESNESNFSFYDNRAGIALAVEF
ncbi:MAG: hypothetical protein WC003_12795 [Terrimicrobiaceae bacterium]